MDQDLPEGPPAQVSQPQAHPSSSSSPASVDANKPTGSGLTRRPAVKHKGIAALARMFKPGKGKGSGSGSASAASGDGSTVADGVTKGVGKMSL
jgi:hypothetical protein